MEKEFLLAELQKNCKKYAKELLDMLKELDLTILGNEVQESQFKEIYKRVLTENEFFAKEEFERGGIEIRKCDRITDEEFTFLLSDDDFDRYQNLCIPYYVEENLTDENGYYITNWSMMVVESRNKIFDFICKKVLPKELGDFFYERKWNITVQEKVIDITKQAFGIAA